MKGFSVYIPVEDLIESLSDEDKTQVKCSYINYVNIADDGNSVEISVIIDDDDTEEYEFY